MSNFGMYTPIQDLPFLQQTVERNKINTDQRTGTLAEQIGTLAEQIGTLKQTVNQFIENKCHISNVEHQMAILKSFEADIDNELASVQEKCWCPECVV